MDLGKLSSWDKWSDIEFNYQKELAELKHVEREKLKELWLMSRMCNVPPPPPPDPITNPISIIGNYPLTPKKPSLSPRYVYADDQPKEPSWLKSFLIDAWVGFTLPEEDGPIEWFYKWLAFWIVFDIAITLLTLGYFFVKALTNGR